jgi:hypothetical protein
MEALSRISGVPRAGKKFSFLEDRFALKLPIAVDQQRRASAAD